MSDELVRSNPVTQYRFIAHRSSLRTECGMRRGALAAIRVYQRWVSPLLGDVCRYEPSCSRYTYEAVERFGVGRGVALGARRLLRCTPLHKGGFDPVPEV